MLEWQEIDRVFLDMDGTLLDLHFDNHFWLSYVPSCYAQKTGLSLAEAKAHLQTLYQAVAGTMDWYCLDYWSTQLDLDIALLKRDVEHLIQVHPHVTGFLAHLHEMGKRVVMVTNAHANSLSLKMEKTQLAGYFDRLICSHDLGSPKEQGDFWGKLQKIEPFSPSRTLLVDDSLSVLQCARAYGIKHLVAIAKPDSQQALKALPGFVSVPGFEALMRLG